MSDEETPALIECVAASMDAETELVDLLPELMADLEDLGARASEVVAVLRQARLPPGCRVLDLGCGKGAAAIAVAQELGGQVKGVDGLEAFVEHARGRARSEGVGERCRFESGDVRDVVSSARGYDLVMMLGLGPIFGDAAETMGTLRQCVREGGYVLLDDAYAEDAETLEALEAVCDDHATTVRKLESHGDRLVAERIIDTEADEAWYWETTGRILARAHALALEHPELEASMMEFAERQRRETETLTGSLVGALWLLEVGSLRERKEKGIIEG